MTTGSSHSTCTPLTAWLGNGTEQGGEHLLLGQGACQQSPDRLAVETRGRRHESEYGRVFERFDGIPVAVHAAHVNGLALRPFIECSRRDAVCRAHQRETDVLPAEADIPGYGLVVIDDEYRYLGLPVACHHLKRGALLHDGGGLGRQVAQDGRVGTAEFHFNREFLVHQVVAFQPHVGVRIVGVEVRLYFVEKGRQCLGRGVVHYQFSIGQRRVGDAPHEVVPAGRAAYRGRDVGDFAASQQIILYGVQVFSDLCAVGPLPAVCTLYRGGRNPYPERNPAAGCGNRAG